MKPPRNSIVPRDALQTLLCEAVPARGARRSTRNASSLQRPSNCNGVCLGGPGRPHVNAAATALAALHSALERFHRQVSRLIVDVHGSLVIAIETPRVDCAHAVFAHVGEVHEWAARDQLKLAARPGGLPRAKGLCRPRAGTVQGSHCDSSFDRRLRLRPASDARP
jgi:hypothetical protein